MDKQHPKTVQPFIAMKNNSRPEGAEPAKALPAMEESEPLYTDLEDPETVEEDDFVGPGHFYDEYADLPEQERIAMFMQGDPQEELRSFVWELELLLENTTKKMNAYDDVLMQQMHKNTSVEVNGMLFLKKVTSALDTRLEQAKAILSLAGTRSFDPGQAYLAVHQDLTIPNDSMNSVGLDNTTPPIPRSNWELTIDEAFKRVSKRPSFYRSLPIQELD